MMLLGVASGLQVLGWSLLAALLGSTLIAAGVGLAQRRIRKPETRYRSMVAGLLVLALLPVAIFLALRFGAVSPAAVWRASHAEPSRTVLVAAVSAWAGGAAVLAAIHVGGWLRLRKLIRSSGSVRPDVHEGVVAPLVRQTGISPAIRVTRDPLLTSPVALGAFRPAVLVPAAVMDASDADSLRHLLAHEFGHVARRDYAMNVIQIAIETLLWFVPAVWWMSRRVRLERECCCDDFAVRVCGDPPLRYARTLVSLDERRTGVPRLAPASSGGELSLRVLRLINGGAPRPARSAWASWAMMLVSLMLGTAAVRPIVVEVVRSAASPSESSVAAGDGCTAEPPPVPLNLSSSACR